MTTLSAILIFIVPAVLAAGLCLAAGLARRRGPHRSEDAAGSTHSLLTRLVPPAAVGFAFSFAEFGVNSFHPVWDKDGSKRFLAVAIAAVLAGLLHAAIARPLPAVLLRALLGAGIAWAVLSPLLGGRYMSFGLLAGLAAGTAAWLACTGALMDRAGRSRHAAAVPGAFMMTALAAAPGVFESGYAAGAMFIGGLGSIAGGLLVLGISPWRDRVLISGASTVWLGLLAAILLVTYAYQEVPSPWALALIGAAPLCAGLAMLRGRGWLTVVATWIVAAVIAVSGTLWVIAASPPEEEGSYYYGDQ